MSGSKPESSPQPPSVHPDPDPDDFPGVPGFKTWRGIYIFVIAFFAVVVVLLTLFSQHYR